MSASSAGVACLDPVMLNLYVGTRSIAVYGVGAHGELELRQRQDLPDGLYATACVFKNYNELYVATASATDTSTFAVFSRASGGFMRTERFPVPVTGGEDGSGSGSGSGSGEVAGAAGGEATERRPRARPRQGSRTYEVLRPLAGGLLGVTDLTTGGTAVWPLGLTEVTAVAPVPGGGVLALGHYANGTWDVVEYGPPPGGAPSGPLPVVRSFGAAYGARVESVCGAGCRPHALEVMRAQPLTVGVAWASASSSPALYVSVMSLAQDAAGGAEASVLFSMHAVMQGDCNATFMTYRPYMDTLWLGTTCAETGSSIVRYDVGKAEVDGLVPLSLAGERKYLTPVAPLLLEQANRLFALLVTDALQALLQVALVGALSVSPRTTNTEGNTLVNVTGYGFKPGMYCSFDGRDELAPATFVNRTLVRCRAPQLGISSCAQHPLTLHMSASPDSVAVTQQSVYQFRVPTVIEAINNSTGGNFGTWGTAMTVSVRGSGFVDRSRAPEMSCRIRGTIITGSSTRDVYRYGRATYVNSQNLLCDFEAFTGTRLQNPTFIEVSVDGTAFSSISAPFNFLSTPRRVGFINLPSADDGFIRNMTKIPTVAVYLEDEGSNRLDSTNTDIDLSRIPIDAATSTPVWLRFTQNSTTRVYLNSSGLALFDNLYLDCPQYVGTVRIDYSFVLFPVGGSSTMGFLTKLDAPHSPYFAQEPSADAVFETGSVSRQPVVGLQDVCGNPFSDLPEGVPWRLRVGLERVGNAAEPSRQLAAPAEEQAWEVGPTGALFYVGNVSLRGAHQQDVYRVSATVAGLPVPRAYAAENITVGWCEPTRVADVAAGTCGACPVGMACNGTAAKVVMPGYWQASAEALTLYSCAGTIGEHACVEGRCAAGYVGPRCASCDVGYREFERECARCESVGANAVLIVLTLAALSAVVMVMVLLLVHSGAACRWPRNVKSVAIVLQYVSFLYYVRAQWPPAVARALQGVYSTGMVVERVASCYLKDVRLLLLLLFAPLVVTLAATAGAAAVVAVQRRRDGAYQLKLAALLTAAYTARKTMEFHGMRQQLVRDFRARQQEWAGESVVPSSALGEDGSVSAEARARSMVMRAQHSFSSSEFRAPRDAGAVEEALIASFERAGGRCVGVEGAAAGGAREGWQTCGAREVALLEAQPRRVRAALARMCVPVPTRTQVHRWLEVSRAEDERAGTVCATAAAVAIVRDYRALAVREFRRSVPALALSAYSIVVFLLLFLLVCVGLRWQACEEVDYGGGDVRRVAQLSNLMCDSARYRAARGLSLVILLVYGVVSPLALYGTAVVLRVRFGKDVAYNALPFYLYGYPPSGFYAELVTYAQMVVGGCAAFLSSRALMQLGALTWVVYLRHAIDYRIFTTHGGSGARVVLCGALARSRVLTALANVQLYRVTLAVKSLLSLLLSDLVLMYFVRLPSVGGFSRRSEYFFVAVALACLGGALAIPLAYLLLDACVACARWVRRPREAGRAAVQARRQELVSLAGAFRDVCAAMLYYFSLTGPGLELALACDEHAARRARGFDAEDGDSDDFEVSGASGAAAELEASASTSARAGGSVLDRSGRGDAPAATSMSRAMRQSGTARAHQLGARLYHSPEGGAGPGAAGGGADFPFTEPAMAEPVDNVNWVAAPTRAEPGQRAAEPPAPADADKAGAAPAASAAAPGDSSPAFAAVPAPCAQPRDHRSSSLILSIRDPDGVQRAAEAGGGAPAVVPPLPPLPAADASRLGFDALPALPTQLDVASGFDPLAVPPLSVAAAAAAARRARVVRAADVPTDLGPVSAPGAVARSARSELLRSAHVDMDEADALLRALGVGVDAEAEAAAVAAGEPAAATGPAADGDKSDPAPPPLPTYTGVSLAPPPSRSRSRQPARHTTRKRK